MKKDPLYEHLREISWRRKLTPSEQAQLNSWLADHPEAQSDWDLEVFLNEKLTALPNIPVASNFTARTVAAAQAEAARAGRLRAAKPAWWHRWLPKAAVAAILLSAALLSYTHLQEAHREELARSVSTVSQVKSLPSPEILKDFDTIAALSSAPMADVELLKVMQ
jgi:hypothetical protein